MFTRFVLVLAFTTLAITAAPAAEPAPAKLTTVFDRPIPNIPGKSLKSVLVEYGPGGASSAHTHAKSAFIYATVLEGAVRSSVNGSPEKVYKAGENWVEAPGAFHGVSANASDTQPARILAVFVVDTDDTELTRFIKK
ncbi:MULTISPECIES: cupin domain-containing protein [unclassified Bosea (in: a-proteobacteria)]|uniref:cupin domain-containing protein n=1 Tax=unclassified Bosea (in: a-proteobacteria) TaxID=2653178 RepID=UPI000F755446|nr:MULTISPECIES: cupin domain-containing protein [unclassified Bosea (in: a-proteobacteria)]AZO79938.1 cupin [Bosea sp. Tri-49]RXT22715.1 cupin [Bosea sp. Tri-39]RXT38183.1 cupin [Bosea sp. Tri-54]